MRSPNWQEGEVMLALDLYLNKDLKWLSRMSDSTFEIYAFSKLLNGLDYYEEKPDNFRTTGSIRMKLANFMALDDRYQMNSLGNVGSLDKKIWKKYSENLSSLHIECIEIIREHLKKSDFDTDKYLEMLKLKVENDFDSDFINFAKYLKRALAYYGKLAEQRSDLQCSDEVLEWCLKTQKSLQWLDEMSIDKIEFDAIDKYKEHGGINLAPIGKTKQKIISKNEDDTEEKIGKLVQRTFSELVDQNRISEEIVNKLLDAKYSKSTFGLKPSFLICVDVDQSIKKQIVDENGYARYWTKPVVIHGKTYCVSKEWYPNQREKYLRWLACVNVKPFYMINSLKLKEVLEYIQKVDDRKISFTRKEIHDKFPDLEIEEVISELLDRGILSGFQGSTKELVVDDYDALYKVIKKPIDYTME